MSLVPIPPNRQLVLPYYHVIKYTIAFLELVLERKITHFWRVRGDFDRV
jgi:hypothetical protein